MSVSAAAPLAERLRPKTLADVVGQQHLLGEGRPLRAVFDGAAVHSCVLWGPPGVGKTTIARLLALAANAQFIELSAATGGVKEVREAVERAQAAALGMLAQRTVVFVDEVHRFNKSQQDALLPHVESGLFTFIGATTENPSFELNAALLSRAQVYVLEALKTADLEKIIEGVAVFWASDAINKGAKIEFQADAKALLIAHSDGDARKLISRCEVVLHAARAQSKTQLSAAWVANLLGAKARRFDKGGDQFYDQISALHKSVRGSDPNASLYWLVRMLDGGADARYLSRRLIRIASEDIGLADPRALELALHAAQAFERLGSPEGELALAQCVVYLAEAPKSNAVYSAFNAAKALVDKTGTQPVPMHLRNAPTQLMKTLGAGKGYRYAHNEPDAFAAAENYWPVGMAAVDLYQPVERGLEIRIAEKLARLRAADADAASAKPSE